MKWMAGFLLRGCYAPVLLYVKDPEQVKGKKKCVDGSAVQWSSECGLRKVPGGS